MLVCLLGSFSLPFVHEAYNEGRSMSKVKELDDLCQACLSNHIANKASIRQVSVYSLLPCFSIYIGGVLPLVHNVPDVRSVWDRFTMVDLLGHF